MPVRAEANEAMRALSRSMPISRGRVRTINSPFGWGIRIIEVSCTSCPASGLYERRPTMAPPLDHSAKVLRGHDEHYGRITVCLFIPGERSGTACPRHACAQASDRRGAAGSVKSRRLPEPTRAGEQRSERPPSQDFSQTLRGAALRWTRARRRYTLGGPSGGQAPDTRRVLGGRGRGRSWPWMHAQARAR